MITNPFNKKILNTIVFLSLLYITGSILFSEENIQGLRQVIFDADIVYYLLGVVAFSGLWFLNAWGNQIILRKNGHHYPFRLALQAVLAGQFYQLITPLATGGQPVLLYYMVRKDGVPLWSATSAVFNRLILYKLMLVVVALAGTLWQFPRLVETLGPAISFTVFGLLLSVLVAASAIAMFRHPSLVSRLAFRLLRMVNRLIPPARMGIREDKLEHLVRQYAGGIGVLLQEKKMLLQVSALMLGNLFCQFISAYFVYRALGFQGESVLTFLAFQAALTVTIFFIPTPGSLGAAEYGFYLFYSGFYEGTTLMVAVLLWRSMTYYVPVLISAAVALWTYWQRRRMGTGDMEGPLHLLREQMDRPSGA